MERTEARYARYGRVSTEDEQDPTLSFPRQLANAERRVAESGGRIVAHFYDIESGTRRYDAPGSGGLSPNSRSSEIGHTRIGVRGFDIPIPRDGGLHDLLAAAGRRPISFDRVIVESNSRLSRNSSVAFRIEEELANCGIRLCAADEPLEESFGTIVLRHVNIGIARGYHHELMVKSRQGLETSTRQGWHTGGIAAYGYRFVTHPHPNPHKAKQGALKRTLELDPVRAPVVRRIFDLYLSGTVGLTQIRDLLNADLNAHPPLVKPDPSQSLGVWSRSSLWEILRNPKYTGYQIWNRRARKKGGRMNHPSAWVWSEEPAHPAIVSREEFEAVIERASANHRTRKGATEAAPRPTDYLYRGLIRCGICGLRMWGKTRRATRYYLCQISHQRAADLPADHPPSVYVGERRLNEAILGLVATAVFGPDREEYWRHALTVAAKPEVSAPPLGRAEELAREIADLEGRLERQVVGLESEEVTPALRRRVAQRVAELEEAISERQERLDRLAAQAPREAPQADDVATVLARLPVIADQLRELPQEKLRAMLEALQLTATYLPQSHEIDVELVLQDDGGSRPDVSQVWSVPPAGSRQHGNRHDQQLFAASWSSGFGFR